MAPSWVKGCRRMKPAQLEALQSNTHDGLTWLIPISVLRLRLQCIVQNSAPAEHSLKGKTSAEAKKSSDQNRNEKSALPVSAWRDTVKPRKAPTATPIPSKNAMTQISTPACRADIPLCVSDNDSRRGQKSSDQNRNEKSALPISAWRDTVKPTKAPTATPIPSKNAMTQMSTPACRADIPLCVSDNDSRGGQKLK